MDSYRMALADRLKEARDRSGLTQARAADRLGVSSASIAAYEQGARDVPDAILEAMARLYGSSAPFLRYGEEVLRAAAVGEVERRIREAAAALQVTAAGLLATVEETDVSPSDRRAEGVASGDAAARARAEPPPEVAPRQKKKRA